MVTLRNVASHRYARKGILVGENIMQGHTSLCGSAALCTDCAMYPRGLADSDLGSHSQIQFCTMDYTLCMVLSTSHTLEPLRRPPKLSLAQP